MDFDFVRLEALRLLANEVSAERAASIGHFAYAEGYGHLDNSGKISVSSTATCVVALTAASSWQKSWAETKKLIRFMLSKKKSAGLPRDNPFTTAWILEAVTALQNSFSEQVGPNDVTEITRKEGVLLEALKNGGVRMSPYPPSGYLTQLVVRVLLRRDKLPVDLAQKTREWAWAELTKELALIQADSKTKDSFAVAYLLILATALTPRSAINPEQFSIQRSALDTFFSCQLPDGSWPLSRPLFHYPDYGNAYCFEYEMLTQLLQEAGLEDLLLEHLPQINLAVDLVASIGYRLEPGVRAWASGHHPQLGKPESWSTASVYHFFHALDRLLAEAVRRELFRHLELPLPNPGPKMIGRQDFAPMMLDSKVHLKGENQSLKKVLWDNLVSPISAKADGIKQGIYFRGETPRSAILFGPPGTSKTELSKEIARFLGWPFVPVDPSLLLRNGMDGIQAEANSIFRILGQTDGVVVLFDEFDELVRERGNSSAEQPFSRLLTTAMLPKLANMHKRGALVFIIATNNSAQFDLAIRRPGRFDTVLQVLPPTCKAKLAKDNWGADGDVDINAKFSSLGVTLNKKVRQQLEELTFGECNAFATELAKATDAQDASSKLSDAWERSTMHAPVSKEDKKTWSDRCRDEIVFNR